MRVVTISDTHERHEELVLPAGDVLICSGDVTANGRLTSLERFARWMNGQPHRHKILIAGNHDFCFEEKPALARQVMREHAPAVHYLEDSGVVIEGLRVWGSPWQPRFYDWAFNLDRGAPLAEKWALIPDDTEEDAYGNCRCLLARERRIASSTESRSLPTSAARKRNTQ